MNDSASPNPPQARRPAIKIFGVGNAGILIIENLLRNGFAPSDFLAVNTDEASLWESSAPEKVHLELKLLRGMGTGGDPERGRAAAEESCAKLKALCEGVDVVFIVTGLGGGAGSGIAPVLARAAKEAGSLALGFVTMPFDCEGKRRQSCAREGLNELKAAADGVICLPNQKLFRFITESTSVLDTFKLSSQMLSDGIAGIWRLLALKGLLPIHFSELCGLLRDRHGESVFAVTEASGAARASDAIEKLLAHPLLDDAVALRESEAVLVSIVGGPDLTMTEINKVIETIQQRCEHGHVLMGAAIDESFRERLAVTLIAARQSESTTTPVDVPGRVSVTSESLDTQLLSKSDASRPGSRFVPPPPALTPEKLQQMLKRQKGTGSRPKKAAARMRQTQLPLDIISKGRFDKSEPTIHRGEDLDVPTYIRRGISLN